MSLDNVLNRYGGRIQNDLNEILGHIGEDDPSDVLAYPTTNYVDIEGLKAYLYTYKDFIVLSINIQCINAKFNELVALLNDICSNNNNLSTICIQETWLGDNDDTSPVELNGYKLIPQGKRCSEHGGLFIYLNTIYEHKMKIIDTQCTSWEFQCIDIYGGDLSEHITLCNVYRPPKTGVNRVLTQFKDEFRILLTSLSRLTGTCAVAGDFNLNILKINERSVISDFFDMMVDHSFYPRITLPTRFSKKSCSLLDQIYVKQSDDSTPNDSLLLFSALSDHFACISSITKRSLEIGPDVASKRRVCDENAILAFSGDIRAEYFLNICNIDPHSDPSPNYDIIHNRIQESLDKHMPLKNVKFNKYKHKKSGWITDGILISLKYRDKLYKLKKAATTEIEYERLSTNLHTYNGILRKLIRDAKFHHYQHQFQKNKMNMRKQWDTLRTLLNKHKTDSFPTAFIHNNIRITDHSTISKGFNEYFKNICANVREPPNSRTDRNTYLQQMNIAFHFDLVTDDNVRLIFKDIVAKNSFGIDDLSTRVLKSIQEPLIPILRVVINQSLLTGIFPEKLKLAKVKPLFKKEDRSLFENYRPISLLPAISKIFEKVVHKQVYDYFVSNNLFFNSQYGYRKQHSTEHATLELVDRIHTALDNGDIPIAIFLDLSKAFDTINHEILLEKLQKYGFHSIALKWFHSYFSNRKQCVRF